jgi:beta-lactam-binding protein with PASTA domain
MATIARVAGEGLGVRAWGSGQHTTEVFNIATMNSKQMKKWLEQQGATFMPGRPRSNASLD